MELAEFFSIHQNIALAFSGGADSAFLLYMARAAGARVHAYYVKSEFQPRFEYEDALRLAGELGAQMTVIETNVLCVPEIAANTPDRCYHCKKHIFSLIAKRAAKDGFVELIDGTNASDDPFDRPGTRALAELSVLSPLRECGLRKPDIRRLSKEAGLFTWDKPAYACLATRIPSGEVLTAEKLLRTEKAEDYMFSLGFTDFRVRSSGDCARIQLPESQMGKLMERREPVVRELLGYYRAVTLDLLPR